MQAIMCVFAETFLDVYFKKILIYKLFYLISVKKCRFGIYSEF